MRIINIIITTRKKHDRELNIISRSSYSLGKALGESSATGHTLTIIGPAIKEQIRDTLEKGGYISGDKSWKS